MPVRKDDKGRWHAEVCIHGQRLHRILPPGAGKKDAESKEDELRKSLTIREYTEDPLLTEVMALYVKHAEHLRSPETALYHAERISEHIEGRRASEAKTVAAKICTKLQANGFKPATINRSLGTLKKALTLAYDHEITKDNHGAQIRRLKENNTREVFLSVEEVRKIADCASAQVRAAIWIALYTGMRRGEILKLRKDHIGKELITIPAGNTKTLKLRSVPVIGPLKRWLEYVPLKINEEGLKSGWQRAREKAGMTHVNFHDLRHSTASLMASAGISLHTISKVLGHSTTRMSERYAHIQADQQKDALSKVFGE
ncbi:MAG: site-specific integrase [Burkholderiaceae bacterium]|nr:site-specific integrase [Burkholderiaceae bacterium]